MRQAFLLGNPDTKRTLYLGRAARQAGLPVEICLLDWSDWPDCLPESGDGEVFLKIDPPLWHSGSLDELEDLTQSYKENLARLARMAEAGRWEFFNHPDAICALLDKRRCKEVLAGAGLAVTESLDEEFPALRRRGIAASNQAETEVERLLEAMRKHRIYQVFVKPLNGSGAAGVAAFRWQLKTGRMALYTCAMETSDGGLVNTKRLRCFMDKAQVFSLLGRILRLGCVVERWYAKAEYRGDSYDLRVVIQDGCQDFMLARLSQGPITNLHLNNHPLEASRLELPEETRKSVFELCRRAMECFPGLRSAGIDVLLEKGGLNPRIIEMNAQGDLLYQDIYQDNLIYRHQAEMIKKWMEKTG